MAKSKEQDDGRTSGLGPLWLQAYLPWFLLSTGQGAMISVLVLSARAIGASSAGAGVIAGVVGFGTMLFDIPSGQIVARLGERRAGWVATGLIFIGLLGAWYSHLPVLLGCAVFVVASGQAVWALRQLTHVSRVAPIAVRGRALALMGGMSRAGNILGPFILVWIATSNGVRSSYLVYLGCVVIAFVLLTAGSDPNDLAARTGRLERIKPLNILNDHRHEFLTGGVATFGINLLRTSRQVLVPLWGIYIGLSASSVALVIGLTSTFELALFYPTGIVSDRFGRRWVAIPCLALLSLGHAMLPIAHSFTSLVLVSLLLGFGNGLGNGIVMTLGADRAPDIGRASFLSVWRFVGDTGQAVGPLVCAGVIAVASLALAGPAIALVGFSATAIVMARLDEPTLLVAPQDQTDVAPS